jgi:uncharacterized protein YciI
MPESLAVLFYDYVADVLDRRGPHRDEHLRLLRALERVGACRMAGALGDPPHGAAFVFADARAAERFVAQDPYVANGLVTAHRIEPWAVAVP